jgi:hypothetical protein
MPRRKYYYVKWAGHLRCEHAFDIHEACKLAFGIVSEDMEVKCIGGRSPKFLSRTEEKRLRENQSGWISPSGKPVKKEIVKIQLSQEPQGQVLVYNIDRTILYQEELPLDIAKLMRGRQKAYFYARMIRGELTIDEEAPKQEW